MDCPFWNEVFCKVLIQYILLRSRGKRTAEIVRKTVIMHESERTLWLIYFSAPPDNLVDVVGAESETKWRRRDLFQFNLVSRTSPLASRKAMGEVLETRVASIVVLTWVEVENFFSTPTRKPAKGSINNANFYFVITVYFADYGWDFFWEATGLHQRNLCIVRLIESLFCPTVSLSTSA